MTWFIGFIGLMMTADVFDSPDNSLTDKQWAQMIVGLLLLAGAVVYHVVVGEEE